MFSPGVAVFLRKYLTGSTRGWGRGPTGRRACEHLGGSASLVLGRPPAGALNPALLPAPSMPWTSSFPSQGHSFHIWRREHWFSVPGGPIHVSLVWVIGQAVGDFSPGGQRSEAAFSLLGAAEFGAWDELSAWLEAEAISWSEGPLGILLDAWVGGRGGGVQRQNLASFGKGPRVPIDPDLQSEGKTYSCKLIAVSKFCISWGTSF